MMRALVAGGYKMNCVDLQELPRVLDRDHLNRQTLRGSFADPTVKIEQRLSGVKPLREVHQGPPGALRVVAERLEDRREIDSHGDRIVEKEVRAQRSVFTERRG